MSEVWQGEVGNWYVMLSPEEYDEIDNGYGLGSSLEDFQLGSDGNWYALATSVVPPDPDGLAWINNGIIGSADDFNMVWMTTSVQANILG